MNHPGPELWQRVKPIVAEAWEMPLQARTEYLAQACAGDEELRLAVEKALHDAETASSLYENPQLAAGPFSEAMHEIDRANLSPAGTTIGPYRIIRELGQGGMGQVCLAERIDGEFEQQVAIKFVRGLLTDALINRFRDERQILATLDHPNIARLIDGGTTADRRPYVIMEYVAGLSIDQFCDERNLDVRSRIELVLRVCDAVQYAHQRFVIHRDLKARNILVTADGTAKLLDFGIAKLLDRELGAADATQTVLRVMTPESASPEQIKGDPVTTATDVYGLGGLLYRLLAGRSPYPFEALTDAQWMRAICDEIPLPPSKRCGNSAVRGVAAAAIDRDLDLIVLKAMRKEPEQRYATVSELSDDLRRFLAGRPVRAAQGNRRYRIRKFVARHRLALLAAAAISIAVILGSLATARQSQIAMRERSRAEGRLDDVRLLVNALMFELHDAIQDLPGSTPARRLLVNRVLEYLEKIGNDAETATQLQLEIATAYQKVGNVQGNPYVANIGDATGAIRSYRKALDITQTLVDRDPTPAHRAALATSHHLVADMLWAQGAFAESLEHYRSAIGLRAVLASADVTDLTKRLDLAESEYGAGQTMLRTGAYRDAVTAFSHSQMLYQEAVQQDPSNIRYKLKLATSTTKLGDLEAVQGDHAHALEHHQKSSVILREALALEPGNVSTKRLLAAILYRTMNDQKELDDDTGAIRSGGEALELQEALLAADPANKQISADAAYTHHTLGQAFAGLNRWREALDQLNTADTMLRTALAGNPSNADNAAQLGLTLLERGEVLQSLREKTSALQSYREAITILQSQTSRKESVRYLALAHEHLADLEVEVSRTGGSVKEGQRSPETCAHYRQALELIRSSPTAESDPRVAGQSLELNQKVAICRP